MKRYLIVETRKDDPDDQTDTYTVNEGRPCSQGEALERLAECVAEWPNYAHTLYVLEPVPVLITRDSDTDRDNTRTVDGVTVRII